MGYMCDFCGQQRSMVYCRSDAAYLCLSCDRNVHSANALSKRHSRTLVCERCNSQPASVRCVEEKASLCRNCDWREHAGSTSSSSHKKQLISCYTGCPSAEELSTIWSFLLDIPASLPDDSNCEQGLGLLSIAENSAKSGLNHASETGGLVAAVGSIDDVQSLDKSSVWMSCSSMPEHVTPHNLDQPSGSGYPVSPKVNDCMHKLLESQYIFLSNIFTILLSLFGLKSENCQHKIFGMERRRSIPYEP